MFIADMYTNDVNTIPQLTNQQYLAWQIWQLNHVFKKELAAIKDVNCEFIAFTDDFAEKFSFNDNLLGKIASNHENECDILKQEQEIISKAKTQNALYIGHSAA